MCAKLGEGEERLWSVVTFLTIENEGGVQRELGSAEGGGGRPTGAREPVERSREPWQRSDGHVVVARILVGRRVIEVVGMVRIPVGLELGAGLRALVAGVHAGD